MIFGSTAANLTDGFFQLGVLAKVKVFWNTWKWDSLVVGIPKCFNAGDSLKPEKCCFYLISFVWKADGKWLYDANEVQEELHMSVPIPDGAMCQIEHLSIDTAKETLGVFTCPSECFGVHLSGTKQKGQEWIDRAK